MNANSTTSIGRDAELRVANYLKKQKHKILALNWRTRWCEIDIVSSNKKCVYFTEVKYRSSDAWGAGLDYITEKKLKQMRFAAEFWLANQDWTGDSVLQAAEVSISGSIYIVELE